MLLNAYVIGIGTYIIYSRVSIRGSLFIFFFCQKSLHSHAHIPYNIKFVYHAHDYNIMTCYRQSNALRLDIPIHELTEYWISFAESPQIFVTRRSADLKKKKKLNTISIPNFVVRCYDILTVLRTTVSFFDFARYIISFILFSVR